MGLHLHKVQLFSFAMSYCFDEAIIAVFVDGYMPEFSFSIQSNMMPFMNIPHVIMAKLLVQFLFLTEHPVSLTDD